MVETLNKNNLIIAPKGCNITGFNYFPKTGIIFSYNCTCAIGEHPDENGAIAFGKEVKKVLIPPETFTPYLLSRHKRQSRQHLHF